MDDPFKYVQNPEDQPQRPINVPINDQPPSAAVSTLEQQARYKKIALIAVIGLVVIVAIAGFSFILLSSESSEVPAQQSATERPAPAPEPVEAEVTLTEETEMYTSLRFFLGFEHPVDWSVEEDSGEGTLTATSPQLELPTVDGGTNGVIVLTIRKSSSKLPEFEAGNAVAVIASEKITYSNPSSAQRGDTYVSYLSFADSASSSLIDGVYISGDFGYKKGQAIPKVDIQKIDPIISVQFYACDGECTNRVGVNSDLPTTKIGQGILQILKTLKVN